MTAIGAEARFRVFVPCSGDLYQTGEYDICGNGIRCFTAYLLRSLHRKEERLNWLKQARDEVRG